MDAREFAEWMAFYSIEPWGLNLVEEQLAFLCARLANMFAGKTAKRAQMEDFLRYRPKPPQSNEEMKAIAKAITLAFGGEIK